MAALAAVKQLVVDFKDHLRAGVPDLVLASMVVFELVHGIVWRCTPAELAQNVGIGAVLGLGVLELHLLVH